MTTAVFLDYASLAPDDLDVTILQQLPIDFSYFDWTAAEQIAERISGNDIILTNKIVIDEPLLKKQPNIKLIVILATGTNNVDLQAAADLNIPVCHMVDYSTQSVAQHTIGVMLALTMQLLPYHHAINDGHWYRSNFFGLLDFQVREIFNKTLGIIGYGQIGQAVATIAKNAFAMDILVANSLSGREKPGRVSLHDLLSNSDVVSVHCPLTPESRNLIDAKAISQMKNSSLLINMGRGGIVDEQAVADALINGHLGGAALDVLQQEPPAPGSSPLFNLSNKNLIITPHTGWGSLQARQNLIDQVTKILMAFLNQQNLPNRV